jgi:hypothetical protein
MASFDKIQEEVEQEWVTDFLTAEDRRQLFENQTQFYLTSVRDGEIADNDGRKDSAGNVIMHPVIYYGVEYREADGELLRRTLTMSANDYRKIQAAKVAAGISADGQVGPVVLVQGPSNSRFNNPRWELASPGGSAPETAEQPNIPLAEIPF